MTFSSDPWIPVTYANFAHVAGPFYHGTKSILAMGELLTIGQPSNYEYGRFSNHLYFSADLETAIWGAELSMAFANLGGLGHVYIVEPTGTFEDDPNVTNKRFSGNPTRSYRTPAPLRITGVVPDCKGHPPHVLQAMLESLQNLRSQGLALIED
jgi:rifampin ADP-ribosylating transferase